jgi:hypothetical protein
MTEERMLDRMDEIIRVLRLNQSWLKILAVDSLKSNIEDLFDEEWEYHLYERLDGDTKIDDLVEGLPTSSSTAGRRLQTWRNLGMARQNEDGKYEKLSTLDTLGIEIPDLE